MSWPLIISKRSAGLAVGISDRSKLADVTIRAMGSFAYQYSVTCGFLSVVEVSAIVELRLQKFAI